MTASQGSLRSRSMEMLLAYQKNPSPQLRNRLVQLNAGLVRKVAHRISHQCSEPYDDLEQIGYLGLMHAIERFNPQQGCAFSSFAVPYIRGEILHFLRDRSSIVRVPRRWQELQQEGQKVKRRLASQLNRQPSDREIADDMGIELKDWHEAQMAYANRMPISLDGVMSQNMDSPVTLGDLLPDVHGQTLQRLEEDRQLLQSALNQLEEKTRCAIEYVFLNGLSRKEVAERIGVSPVTVTRRVQRGLNEMMTLLSHQQLQVD